MTPSPAGSVRAAIRVTPGARRAGVGGTHGDALVVRVAARAIEGRATDAALAAVAEALGVRPRTVRLVAGATSREKVVEITPDGPDQLDRIRRRLAELRAGTG